MREFTYVDAFEIRDRGFVYAVKSLGEPLTEETRIHLHDEILLNGLVFKVVGLESWCTLPRRYMAGPNNDLQSCLLEFLRPLVGGP